MSLDQVSQFQKTVGYTFKDLSLLERALTHRSALDGEVERRSNERLEFLGDRVFNLIISDILLKEFESEPEGSIARRYSALVNAETLAKVARKIDLGNVLILSASEERSGGRDKTAILADGCEALIGALYRDGGLEAARGFIISHWIELLEEDFKPPVDPKTALQEFAQGLGHSLPSYSLVTQSGPDHAPEFTIQVSVEGYESQKATASNKKEAEKLAAEKLLQSIEALKEGKA